MKCNDYKIYRQLNDEAQTTDYGSNSVLSEGAKGSLTTATDPNFYTLPISADNDDTWDFDCVICEESAQCISVKCHSR